MTWSRVTVLYPVTCEEIDKCYRRTHCLNIWEVHSKSDVTDIKDMMLNCLNNYTIDSGLGINHRRTDIRWWLGRKEQPSCLLYLEKNQCSHSKLLCVVLWSSQIDSTEEWWWEEDCRGSMQYEYLLRNIGILCSVPWTTQYRMVQRAWFRNQFSAS